MIPRTIAMPDDAEIRPQFSWAALLLAHQHRIDQLAAGEAWTCACRCCRWARTHSDGDKPAGMTQ
jgi:hypothetical protein